MAIQIMVKTAEARMRDTRNAYKRKCGEKTSYDKVISPLKAMIQKTMGEKNMEPYAAGMFLRSLMKGAGKLTGTKGHAFTSAIYDLIEEKADATYRPTEATPDLEMDEFNEQLVDKISKTQKR
jgi:hypothetical protein